MHHIDANTPPGSPGLQVGLLNLQVQQNETPVRRGRSGGSPELQVGPLNLQVQQNETPVRRGRRRVKGKNAKVYRDLSALQIAARQSY